jgi:hypothetical protein
VAPSRQNYGELLKACGQHRRWKRSFVTVGHSGPPESHDTFVPAEVGGVHEEDSSFSRDATGSNGLAQNLQISSAAPASTADHPSGHPSGLRSGRSGNKDADSENGSALLSRRHAAVPRYRSRPVPSDRAVNGYDFADLFPKIVEAVTNVPVRSCVIDGEAIVVDENALSVFQPAALPAA